MAKSKPDFGYAPPETPEKNKRALRELCGFLQSNKSSSDARLADQISIVKGMFNRILRRDRKDWATVRSLFGEPAPEEIIKIVQVLPGMRRAILRGNQAEIQRCRMQLGKTKILTYAKNYLLPESLAEQPPEPEPEEAAKPVEKKTMSAAKPAPQIHWINPDPVTIWIYRMHDPCRTHSDMVEPVTAKVPSVRDREPHAMNIAYCRHCKKYYITSTSFNLYASKYGMPLIQIAIAQTQDTKCDYALWREESVLHFIGYNVSAVHALSAAQRQQILVEALDAGLVTKPHTVAFLEGLIRRNRTRENYRYAVSKWEDDLRFVLDYKVDRQRHVCGEWKIIK